MGFPCIALALLLHRDCHHFKLRRAESELSRTEIVCPPKYQIDFYRLLAEHPENMVPTMSNRSENSIFEDRMDPVAIIGFSARMPQDADTPEGFWRMLSEGRSTRTHIPKDRFNVDAFYHPDPERVDAVSLSHTKVISLINIPRPMFGPVILSKETLRHLMLPSLPYRQWRLSLWILSSVCCLKNPTRH